MTVQRLYRCDLCNETNKERLIGIYWVMNDKMETRPYSDVEHHICFKCVSAIQKIPLMCGQGVKTCSNGPDCDWEHK